jgi:hypothetical protein
LLFRWWYGSVGLPVGFGASRRWEVGPMAGTMWLQAGRLELESIVRAPIVVIADPVVAASGPPPSVDELAGTGAGLVGRSAGSMLVFANPDPDSGLFVWATKGSLAVVADPETDAPLEAAGQLTVCSGRLVVGAPDVVAAWGADVDSGDGSPVRARVHRGRTRLGLIVVAHTDLGQAAVTIGAGAAAVLFPSGDGQSDAPLALAG